MHSIEQLEKIRQNIHQQQKKSSLASLHVTLIAVSKTHPTEAIIPLIQAGQLDFGENRVQEAAEKWPALRELYPHIKLHLIGSLQTNKVKAALSLFDVIQTIDRPSLVDAIVHEMQKSDSYRCKQFFIQVNTGEEPQKGGVIPQELPELIKHIRSTPLAVSGLMCVPPSHDNPAPHFALLYKLAHELNLLNLSMGMSGDYETAIRLGATHIRVGTALFGERLAQKVSDNPGN